jgi:hypothetical protein
VRLGQLGAAKKTQKKICSSDLTMVAGPMTPTSCMKSAKSKVLIIAKEMGDVKTVHAWRRK